MALYIKPPSGCASLEKLQNFITKRLIFLYYVHGNSVENISKIIEKEALTENSECLIEGTAKDKISHFTLRFLCASDLTMQEFLIQSETKLFSYRLQFYDFSNLRDLLQKASKQSKCILSNKSNILKSYKSVLKSLVQLTEEVELVIKNKSSIIKVPFTSALIFVKERLYPLQMGYISMPLKDLKLLLVHLFEELLVQGMNQLKASPCIRDLNDHRMHYMHEKIKKWLLSKFSNPAISSGKRFVNGSNLMSESLKFPFCMFTLYNQLLKHHRLKHTSRIQFILFLKEIGMPCSDVKHLFMKEYSMPAAQNCHTSHSLCSHNWIDSEKRYIYSIEHLYGMRGACKNYRAHSCSALQSTYDSEGGCPFATFDEQNLQKSLRSQCFEVKDIEDIISMSHQEKYNEACRFYLLCKAKMHHNEKNYSCCTVESMESRSVCINRSKSDFMHSKCALLNQNNQTFHILSQSLPLNLTRPSDFYFILSAQHE